MSKHINRIRIRFLSLIIISVLLIGTFSTTVSATAYSTSFTKGTEFFQVTKYYKTTWQTTVGSDSNPSDWFGGDANITGAQSKFTTMGWASAVWEMYDFLISMFLSDSNAALALMVIGQKGYNETEINNNYNNTYSLTSGMRSQWYFVSGAFNESSISAIDMPIILNNPADYKQILDDYNNLAYEIRADNFFPYDAEVEAVFQNMTADDFLWQLALNSLAIGTPISTYIQELVNALGCENVSYSGNTLIIERTGETNYTVEITYGAQGTITSFVVKNDVGTIIYQFISLGNTNWIVSILVGVIIACFSGLIVYLVYRKKKFNKLNR